MSFIISIGLMTGSSMDGIDAAVIKTDGFFLSERISALSFNFSPKFHLALRVVEFAVQQELGDLKKAEANFLIHAHKYLEQNLSKTHLLKSDNATINKKITISIVDLNDWQEGELKQDNIPIDEVRFDEVEGAFEIERQSVVDLHDKRDFQIATHQFFKDDEYIELLLPTQIEILLTKYHAKLVNDLCANKEVSKYLKHNKKDLESYLAPVVTGMHGQTLYHNPSLKKTLQMGDGKLLCSMTGISVVNNFRQADIDNGGQGAPLAPLYHLVAARNKNSIPLIIINCGGISNVTIIRSDDPNEIIGFDTGPGNVLLDRYIRKKTQNKEFMDFNGNYGKKGKIDSSLLSCLKENAIDFEQNFWLTLPPKSLDSSNFKLPEEIFELSIEDACCTLAFFTAWSIIEGLKLEQKELPNKIILAGGGWKNPVIKNFFIEIIKDLMPSEQKKTINILDADTFGLSSQYMEAETFAYLAARRILSLPTSYPKVTGARTSTIGGNIYSS
jgi:anhydro-N-acetylmuramic acid kinase